MAYQLLSYPLDPAAPRPPAIPAPEIQPFMSIAKDGASVQKVLFYNHTGTHLDTAAHVLEGGISLEEFTPEDFIFTAPALIDLRLPDKALITAETLAPFKEKIQRCDMLLIRLEVADIRKNEPARFSCQLPGFTTEAAQWLNENCLNLRCLGTDLPSFACIADLPKTMAAHNVFLTGNERKKLIVEEMALADARDNYSEVLICPWLIKGMNSGPCSVLAK